MISVNTDPLNILMQKNLNTAQNAVSKALERMSTGFKINSAKDDAAGLYIATKMNNQIRGLKQAYKNTQTGISFLNTGLGAFSNMTDILNRLRDLSVQAANGVYDETARTAMQKEADSLVAQLEQITNSTNFNGRYLFNQAENAGVAGISGLRGGLNGATWHLRTDDIPAQNVNKPVSGTSTSAPSFTTPAPTDPGSQADGDFSNSITFSSGQTQTINIDGVNYTVRNTQTTDNDFSYSKNLETGEVTFLCSNFQITGAKDVSHNVILRGRGLTFYGGDLSDKILIFENSDGSRIYANDGDDEIISNGSGSVINCGGGSDTVTVNSDSNTVNGDSGNNIYNINWTNATINGGDGNETFNLNGKVGYTNSGINAHGKGGDDIFNVSSICDGIFVDGGEGYNVINDDGKNTVKVNVVDSNGNDVSNTFRVDFAGNETKTILIDGKEYKITNERTTENQIYYSVVDGSIHFRKGDYFSIEAQKDAEHNVVLWGNRCTFYGGDLADTILIRRSNTTVYGGAGDDNITVNADNGNQKVYGEDGNDTITIKGSFYGKSIADGGNGDDVFNIASNMQGIYGREGNDTFNISGSNNGVNCGNGDDIINYTNSNCSNNIIIGGSGTNTVNGSSGTNYTSGFDDSAGSSISFSSKGEQKTISINGVQYTITNNLDSANELFYFYNPVSGEIVFGGSYFDIKGEENKQHNILLYTSYSTLTTGSLDDKILIIGETNTVYAGAGNDTFINENGYKSYLYGEDGDDIFYSNRGRNDVYGGSGDDEFFMRVYGQCNYYGEAGNDLYHFLTNSIVVKDTEGNNVYNIDTDNNKVIGGSGQDTFYVRGDNNTINGQQGDDFLVVDGNNNYVDGGTGMNLISGSSTNSTIINGTKDPNSGQIVFAFVNEQKTIVINGKTYTFTNQNADGTSPASNVINYSFNPITGELVLSGSNYTLDAQPDTDHRIQIQGDNNTINGGNAQDTITVQSGSNNIINTNDGDDTVITNSAGNTVNTGNGDDSITLNSNANNTIVDSGDGNDRINVSSDRNNINSGIGNDTLNASGSNNTLQVNDGNNNVVLSGSNNNIIAGNGDNNLSASGSLNTITAGNGDNIIGILGNENTLNTQDGNNRVNIYGNSNTVSSGSGQDIIQINGNTNNINTGAGQDSITISGSQNIAAGGDDNDAFVINRGTENNIDGNAGDYNTMINYGNNTIYRNVVDITPDPTDIRLQVGANADTSSCINITIDFRWKGLTLDFTTTESARNNIELIDELQDEINTEQAKFGAVINRLESAMQLQTTQIENLTASKSTIMDADIAQESAEYVKNQILSQTASALMVSWQNSRANSILNLLPA